MTWSLIVVSVAQLKFGLQNNKNGGTKKNMAIFYLPQFFVKNAGKVKNQKGKGR